MTPTRAELEKRVADEFGGDERAQRAAPLAAELLARVIETWSERYRRAFPSGTDGRDVAARFSEACCEVYDSDRRFEAAFWGPRRIDSRRTIVALACAAGLPKRTWRRADDAASRLKRQVKPYIGTPGTPFDPYSTRFRVFEDLLTTSEVSRLRRLAVARLRQAHKNVTNAMVQVEKGNVAVDTTGATDVLAEAHIDIVARCVENKWLASGYKSSDKPCGASFVYCSRADAKRPQQWHRDYAASVDGGKYLSIIVALDDRIVLPSVGAENLQTPLPEIVSESTPPTARIPIPRGGCIIFRGDHVHAFMRHNGRATCRLHVYAARVARKKDVKVPGKLYFIA